MIKHITKLEKSKIVWSVIWIFLGFFLLRLPSLIEPNWYGDEGYYQIMGRALNHGSMLYSQIWDNKPPLLYLTYAFFHGDQFSVRLASLFVGLAATGFIFALVHTLFSKPKISIITTAVFAFLFGIPLIEGNIANAENFMLLPIIAAALLIYKSTETKNDKLTMKKIVVAGFLLGIAFLFKIVALFDFAAFFVFLLILSLPERKIMTMKTLTNLVTYSIKHLSFFLLGFLLPIAVAVIYFVANHTFSDFIHATLFGNIGYVNYGNKLFIAQGLLIIKLLLLATAIGVVVWKRNHFSKATIFTLLWVAFSLFDAFFSQRPYTHYVLVTLPSICLFLALVLYEQKTKTKQVFISLFIAILILITASFNIYSLKKTVLYYQNAVLFITGKRDTKTYQAFFDDKAPRDYAIAAFLKMNTKPNDPVFIWGDDPQIYVLSQTLPINKYVVAYQMRQSKESMATTERALNTVKPKYVIILFEAPNMPFRLTDYTNKFSLNRAAIYERTP